MNIDLHLYGDQLKPIGVSLFDEDDKASWGTVHLRTGDDNVTLFLTQEQLHELSHNIVDAFMARDGVDELEHARRVVDELAQPEPLVCDTCAKRVIVVDGRYKHADPTDVTKDGWYSCSILTAALAGSALVASVNGAMYTDVAVPS